jgi:hypothetical protein
MDEMPFSLVEAAVHARLLHSSEPSESISVHGYVSAKRIILKKTSNPQISHADIDENV